MVTIPLPVLVFFIGGPLVLLISLTMIRYYFNRAGGEMRLRSEEMHLRNWERNNQLLCAQYQAEREHYEDISLTDIKAIVLDNISVSRFDSEGCICANKAASSNP